MDVYVAGGGAAVVVEEKDALTTSPSVGPDRNVLPHACLYCRIDIAKHKDEGHRRNNTREKSLLLAKKSAILQVEYLKLKTVVCPGPILTSTDFASGWVSRRFLR